LTNYSSKKFIRKELYRKTQEFLSRGGEIKYHLAGETGESIDKPRTRSNFITTEPRKTRTSINDVISALDKRKKKKSSINLSKSIKSPKKRIIYDDFGEPIREIWSDH
jgi:hypothetical protein